MSIKEMLQDLALLKVAIKRVSGEIGVERVINDVLVEKIWSVVMAQTYVKNYTNPDLLTRPPEFEKAKKNQNTLELEVYYQLNHIIN